MHVEGEWRSNAIDVLITAVTTIQLDDTTVPPVDCHNLVSAGSPNSGSCLRVDETITAEFQKLTTAFNDIKSNTVYVRTERAESNAGRGNAGQQDAGDDVSTDEQMRDLSVALINKIKYDLIN